MRTKLICITLLFSIAFLSFCRKQLPDENLEFSGNWYGSDTELIIRSNGYGSYQYSDGFVSKSISGRVVIKGTTMKFAFLTFRKKYTIDRRPQADASGNITMILSGEEFTKQ